MKKLPSVLLIDDDSTNNFLNERLLARLEIAEQVLVAESGRQALAQQGQPPVVLMLTTSMDAKDLARIDELQIDGLVSKPLTEAKLLDLLRLHFPAYLAA